ncbi:unnamed protein product [Nezara viridula]|uniref:Uncharacterized protein n=1 Tax=Nezara viridula TaxID=85310 RepID=A0A9P0HQ80_NEZVI|nr:unnamed protein product [Nezara viridula]
MESMWQWSGSWKTTLTRLNTRCQDSNHGYTKEKRSHTIALCNTFINGLHFSTKDNFTTIESNLPKIAFQKLQALSGYYRRYISPRLDKEAREEPLSLATHVYIARHLPSSLLSSVPMRAYNGSSMGLNGSSVESGPKEI